MEKTAPQLPAIGDIIFDYAIETPLSLKDYSKINTAAAGSFSGHGQSAFRRSLITCSSIFLPVLLFILGLSVIGAFLDFSLEITSPSDKMFYLEMHNGEVTDLAVWIVLLFLLWVSLFSAFYPYSPMKHLLRGMLNHSDIFRTPVRVCITDQGVFFQSAHGIVFNQWQHVLWYLDVATYRLIVSNGGGYVWIPHALIPDRAALDAYLDANIPKR